MRIFQRAKLQRRTRASMAREGGGGGRRFRFCEIHVLAAALRMDQACSGTQVSAGWWPKSVVMGEGAGATDIDYEWCMGRSLRNLPTRILSSLKFIFTLEQVYWKIHSAVYVDRTYKNEM